MTEERLEPRWRRNEFSEKMVLGEFGNANTAFRLFLTYKNLGRVGTGGKWTEKDLTDRTPVSPLTTRTPKFQSETRKRKVGFNI